MYTKSINWTKLWANDRSSSLLQCDLWAFVKLWSSNNLQWYCCSTFFLNILFHVQLFDSDTEAIKINQVGLKLPTKYVQLKRLQKRWEVNFAITAWLVKNFYGTRIIDVIIIDLWKPFKVTTLDRKRAKLDDSLRPSYSKQTEEATPHLPTSRRDFQWVPVEQKESK